jgi:TRAP-type C4-dicarboxylate transport system permease small subunit
MNDNMQAGSPADHAALPSVTRPLAILGGMMVLASALTVVVSVLVRWSGVGAIGGDFEIVQMATALSVFAFLPYCQARRGNIVVDTFTNWLPKRAQNSLDALWDVVYAIMAGIISWQLMRGAAETIQNHTVSMVLGLPTGWAIAASSVLAAILCFVTLLTAWRLLRSPS